MFLESLGYFLYDLNKLGIIILTLFLVFTLIRANVIFKILIHLRDEFNVFFVELNPHTSIAVFFLSGGSLLFSFSFLVSKRYVLDEYLEGKRKLLFFVTFLRFLILIVLIYILIKIRVIVL